MNMVDEKIDVYSLGNIFYKVLMNKLKYNDIDALKAEKLIVAGDIPVRPGHLEERTDPVILKLKRTMHMCLILDPEERATAKQVADFLEDELKKLESRNKRRAPRRLLRTITKGDNAVL